MTPVATVAGGLRLADEANLEVAGPEGDAAPFTLRYSASSESAGISYPIRIERARLTAVVRRGEHGWTALAPELNAVGYGGTWEAALEDLSDSIEQYLEFLRDDAPALAPATARHGAYVALLNAPRSAWFASVSLDAADLE